MKNLVLCLFLSIFSSALSAQIGISGAYSNIGTPGWEDIISSEGVNQFNNGYTIGIDYWSRLKDYRIEFLPELSYSRFDNEFDGTPLVPSTLNSELSIIALTANTQIYLFDLEGDCDCPTWGKEGGFFNKGFFISIGPGVSLIQHSDIPNLDLVASENVESTSLRFLAAVGLGFDIGITKSITATLFAKYKWHAPGVWDGLDQLIELSPSMQSFEDTNSAITQFEPGLKIHYRWGE